jgi:hypothetical protein
LSDEFIYPEGITVESLKQVFEENFMEVAVDTDGDLIVKDDYRCYLRPDADGRLVCVYAIFGANPDAAQPDKLDYVNRVNDQVKLIRASVSDNGKFYYEYWISVEGGVARRSIVLAVRRFLHCLSTAFSEDTGNVVA